MNHNAHFISLKAPQGLMLRQAKQMESAVIITNIPWVERRWRACGKGLYWRAQWHEKLLNIYCGYVWKKNKLKLQRIPVVHGIPWVKKQWRCVPGFVCTPSLHLDSSPNWDFQTHCARKHRSSGQYFGSVQKREMEEELQDYTVTWPRSTCMKPRFWTGALRRHAYKLAKGASGHRCATFQGQKAFCDVAMSISAALWSCVQSVE